MTHTTDATLCRPGTPRLNPQAAARLLRRAAAGLLGAATVVAALLGPSAAPALAATSPLTITATLKDGTWLGTFSSASSLATSPCVTLNNGTIDSKQIRALQPSLVNIKTFQKKTVLLNYSTSTQTTTVTLSQASVPAYIQGPTQDTTWVKFNCDGYTVSNKLTSPTQVSCTPNPATHPGTITCAVTVRGGASIPTGSVHWGTGNSGQFSATDCALSLGKCSVTYTTGALDAGKGVVIAAVYSGEALYRASEGKTTVTVAKAA